MHTRLLLLGGSVICYDSIECFQWYRQRRSALLNIPAGPPGTPEPPPTTTPEPPSTTPEPPTTTIPETPTTTIPPTPTTTIPETPTTTPDYYSNCMSELEQYYSIYETTGCRYACCCWQGDLICVPSMECMEPEPEYTSTVSPGRKRRSTRKAGSPCIEDDKEFSRDASGCVRICQCNGGVFQCDNSPECLHK